MCWRAFIPHQRGVREGHAHRTHGEAREGRRHSVLHASAALGATRAESGPLGGEMGQKWALEAHRRAGTEMPGAATVRGVLTVHAVMPARVIVIPSSTPALPVEALMLKVARGARLRTRAAAGLRTKPTQSLGRPTCVSRAPYKNGRCGVYDAVETTRAADGRSRCRRGWQFLRSMFPRRKVPRSGCPVSMQCAGKKRVCAPYND